MRITPRVCTSVLSLYMYVWACVTPSTLGSAVVDNIRWRIVGVMFPPSIFEDRCVDFRSSGSSISWCVDLRRSMCRLSKIDVSTFGDRWSMCRPSKIGDWCVDLWTSMVDVKLGCYTCSKHWYYNCMRITPRVCTSVLSLVLLLCNLGCCINSYIKLFAINITLLSCTLMYKYARK